MGKLFKYTIAILIVLTLTGIFIALNMSRPKLTFSDKMRLSQIIAECNADLPREIGTIGYLDSMSFADETITYAVSVKGDNRIMLVYSENYDEFKDMLKFIGILAISHSNMVLVYRESKLDEQISIKIPYIILKNHCKVSQELL